MEHGELLMRGSAWMQGRGGRQRIANRLLVRPDGRGGRNLGRRGAAALEPDELASNPESRGVVETLCNSLKEAGGQKGR